MTAAPTETHADIIAKYPLLFKDGALFLDNTALEKITTCPRSAFYYLVRKREGDGKKGALNFGSGVHEGLAYRYSNAGVYNDGECRQKSCEKTHEHFLLNPQPDDEWRTADLAVRVVDKYCNENITEIFTVNKDSIGKPVVECGFAVPIGEIDGIPIIWTGKIDVAITLEQGLWLMDHKTTSILGPTYFQQFYNAGQFIGYTWAYRQLTGQQPRGVLINAIAVRKPSKTGKEIEFARERIAYTNDQVNEWQNNTLNIIATFLGYCNSGYFPMHTAWCHAKYGVCPYFDVCTLPTAQREILLTSRAYKDVTWSPLND